VRRLEPVHCLNGHPIDRIVVRKRTAAGSDFAFCNECGEKTSLPQATSPYSYSRTGGGGGNNRRAADERSRFEQVIFRLKTY